MRVKITSAITAMPELHEIKKVSAELKDEQLVIHFEGETPIEATIFTPDEECVTNAKRTYNSLLTELALNGYTNLCIGEQTCLLNEHWSVTEYPF